MSFEPGALDADRDLRHLAVAPTGTVEVTSDVLEPVRLLDDNGCADESVRGFVRNLVACDYSPATCRSYVLSLLRWRRFLAAVDVAWDRAERRDVRDFVLWMKGADNAQRHHSRPGAPTPGTVNTVTGKRTLSLGYAPATINHALAAIRMYYEYHLETGLGPMVNPLPAQRGRGGDRPLSHRSPIAPVERPARAAYRQRKPGLPLRALPDAVFDQFFVSLSNNRDRAIVALAVSSGARAAELLGLRLEDLDIPASPQLASVLAQVITRAAGPDGKIPLTSRHDEHERSWSDPLPHLFQYRLGGRPRAFSSATLREYLYRSLAHAGMSVQVGQRLTPHDFRRLFTTDAVNNGLLIHIAAALLGHQDLNTTMGYTAIYPKEVFARYSEFIERRRADRPVDDYRAPTARELADFADHFGQRRIELGSCVRPYATPCSHEHACLRCPFQQIDPEQLPRLVEIRLDIKARIDTARQQQWHGDVAQLEQTLRHVDAKQAELLQLLAEEALPLVGASPLP